MIIILFFFPVVIAYIEVQGGHRQWFEPKGWPAVRSWPDSSSKFYHVHRALDPFYPSGRLPQIPKLSLQVLNFLQIFLIKRIWHTTVIMYMKKLE